ncbi:CDP-diacylglycerol--glycerol-3-phosphate 3-phosphatidyltransferase [Oenococcus kitaharae]|uniref:CDP-diacylglycerol--glycerol-3-phosphate 3-phosphatidyltransferase n=1 Tax=Oenococcus kitaharae DSM 17330 TaxID=1045004 RepID=G9WGM5_9LACO|nr:CDP-diacylglycerol--glycerol-3-phosphate 3-phosphatidyltransferase [Oenococcus kitaharae]EHN59852.1 CDP-diacylglycerol--glycerol-3-phosphate 3-phosphatidyltransferase [Oenococcus kitaharae DSM 17330]OEY82046.1 CDP-diacylglycerol--glycerol-3-phosphate 3-phosphatidyltransferase [Oenococcus kitaharae]OEY82499.1 CDP-diacylglycerol--glycerol-3-phosphate 3-phosphatidyltransferase [Oenococcus kitaharae]OEY83759.1 CDP-diacylglycerol--glycerol-3-phosphate 3-phosphatidyltransferase [Oenococcus kitahar
MNLPNKLTTFRILMIPLFILILSLPINWSTTFGRPSGWLLAAVIFALASLTDLLDGRIARSRHLVTNFGKFADPLADKLLVMTALIFLTQFGAVPAWMTAIIVIRELAITGLRTLIVENNGTVMAAQMPGKIKTFTQMFAIIFLYCSNFGSPIPIGQILIYLAVIFTIYSGIDYFVQNRSVFSDGM